MVGRQSGQSIYEKELLCMTPRSKEKTIALKRLAYPLQRGRFVFVRAWGIPKKWGNYLKVSLNSVPLSE